MSIKIVDFEILKRNIIPPDASPEDDSPFGVQDDERVPPHGTLHFALNSLPRQIM